MDPGEWPEETATAMVGAFLIPDLPDRVKMYPSTGLPRRD
jgi:hypothetical protein